MPLFLLFILASFLHQSEGEVTASMETVSSWNGGSQAKVVIKNSGPDPVCSVKFQLQFPSGVTISSSWNMEKSGNDQFSLPSWVNIPVGGQSTDPGMVLSGSGTPSVSVVSSSSCGGGGGSETTTTAAPGQTTPTTTTSSGGGNPPTADTLTVTTDPGNAALNNCLKSSAQGPILNILNKPYNNGIFTFYGAGGNGACGLDSGKPGMSAAASGQLWDNSAQWVPPCQGSQYMFKDAICIGKCVKITYKCVGCSTAKTLIVPINNKCPECAPDHVDLSIAAFNYLEPQGGTVGIAKNAVITYIDCP